MPSRPEYEGLYYSQKTLLNLSKNVLQKTYTSHLYSDILEAWLQTIVTYGHEPKSENLTYTVMFEIIAFYGVQSPKFGPQIAKK